MSIRLKDPKGLLGDKLEEISNKIDRSLGQMARSNAMGGNPFYYALLATKNHIVISTLDGKPEDLSDETRWQTAATDGIDYFWHPNFITNINQNNIRTVLIHEGLHVVCRHPERCEGRLPRLWNLAIDYFVNASIERDSKIQSWDPKSGKDHPIWNGSIGKPMSIQMLKERWKEQHQRALQKEKDKKEGKEEARPVTGTESFKDENKDLYCCADVVAVGERSADEIYKELYEFIQKECPEQASPDCDCTGDPSFDGHMKLKVSRKEMLRQLLNAAESARRMKGSVPSDILEELKELEQPSLTWQDLCRQSLRRTKQSKGNINDWTRFRKRALSQGFYTPSKVKYDGKVLVLLDTSGSMSDDDIAYGVSQLAVLDKHATGWVVPVDADPKWDKAVEIRKVADLKKIKICGRGGTYFETFFRDYQSKMSGKGPFDLIICITDGWFGEIPKELKPPCDTVFVIVNDQKIDPPFGFCAPLRKTN